MKTYMMKIVTTIGEIVAFAIFGIGLITVYNYISAEFPLVWKIVTTSVFTIGAAWYLWEVVVKNFIAGYRDRSPIASQAEPSANKAENPTADRL